MKRELYIEISSPTTFWLVATTLTKITSSSSISVWQNATRTRMASIFLSAKARTWLALLDTQVSTLTSVTSSHEEMISRPSGTYCCTSWEAVSHGKDSLADRRTRNTTISKRRSLKLRSTSCAKDIPKNSASSWTIAASSSLPRTPTTSMCSVCSRAAWRKTVGILKSLTSSGTRIA